MLLFMPLRPSIFVLDESSANLDIESIEILRKQIAQVKENGHTVVIAEHRLYFLTDLPEASFSPGHAELLVQGLSYAYQKHKILNQVNFSATSGDIIGIVGRNGVGKSTFCQCMCGLLKKQSGTISFHGKPLSLRERRKLCALVMQDVNHQLFSDSVWEECKLSTPSETSANIETLLKRFDLLEFREAHPMALSGGQKQLLAVAAAILSRKKY